MKKEKDPISAKTFEDYFSTISEKQHLALEELREIIREAAPMAEEKLIYGLPFYQYLYMLVGFAAVQNHCSFYLMSPVTMKTFVGELKNYSFSAATIHFTPENPLPAELIRRIVAARIAENEVRKQAKSSKK